MPSAVCWSTVHSNTDLCFTSKRNASFVVKFLVRLLSCLRADLPPSLYDCRSIGEWWLSIERVCVQLATALRGGKALLGLETREFDETIFATSSMAQILFLSESRSTRSSLSQKLQDANHTLSLLRQLATPSYSLPDSLDETITPPAFSSIVIRPLAHFVGV